MSLNPGFGCGCSNWWNNAPQSVCGSFEEPTVPDEGQCSPYRVKLYGEAPVLPTAQCGDTEYITIYQPEVVERPFVVSARLFDDDCGLVLDNSGLAIGTIIA